MSFDDDSRDTPFIRTAATIRIVSAETGNAHATIDIPERVIERPFAPEEPAPAPSDAPPSASMTWTRAPSVNAEPDDYFIVLDETEFAE